MVDLTDAGMTLVIDRPSARPPTDADKGAGADAGADTGAGADGGVEGEKQYFVPFDPPLQDLQGIRPRVIEMAHTAAKALRPDEPEPAGHGRH